MAGFARSLHKAPAPFRLCHRRLASRIDVLGIGNPLVDFTVFEDHGLMARYGIPRHAVSEIGSAHRRIFEDVQKPPHKPIVVLGGATQNVTRIAQWTLGEKGRTAFYGPIADDDLGAVMQRMGAAGAVETHYQVRRNMRTGALLSLNLQHEAAMVIDYGTAAAFRSDAFGADLEALMASAALIYVGAYLWSMSPATARSIARHAAASRTPLATDLQSSRFCPYFASRQHDSLRHVDLLFGNAAEALSLAQCLARSAFPFAKDFRDLRPDHASPAQLLEIARRVAALPKSGPGPRRVVFTNGAQPAVFCDAASGEAGAVPALPMPTDAIKDPRGRGDAFIGGFLASAARGADTPAAIYAGMSASTAVLQSIGCNPQARR